MPSQKKDANEIQLRAKLHLYYLMKLRYHSPAAVAAACHVNYKFGYRWYHEQQLSPETIAVLEWKAQHLFSMDIFKRINKVIELGLLKNCVYSVSSMVFQEQEAKILRKEVYLFKGEKRYRKRKDRGKKRGVNNRVFKTVLRKMKALGL